MQITVHFDQKSVPTVCVFCCRSFLNIRSHWHGMHCMGLGGVQMGLNFHHSPTTKTTLKYRIYLNWGTFSNRGVLCFMKEMKYFFKLDTLCHAINILCKNFCVMKMSSVCLMSCGLIDFPSCAALIYWPFDIFFWKEVPLKIWS